MADRAQDGLLDKIAELVKARDDTLGWLDLLIESDEERAELYWFLIDQLEGCHVGDAHLPVA